MEQKQTNPLQQIDEQKHLGNGQSNGHAGLNRKAFSWPRLFGSGDPYEQIMWEKRTAKITKADGTVVFEQNDIEIPNFWSQTATDIVASKYFRGRLSSPDRESSARQMVDRVAKTIGYWGMKDGYFSSVADCENFIQDLTWLLINQYFAFNSPVWFNVGVQEKPQCSACFILAVEDTMQSILEWYRDEGWIFKYGSGSGINVSKLRSSKEPLSKGGFSSGPVSFMKGADGVANSIRSGGTTRRAAKMVVMNVDHPDIKDFIYSKKIIEDMTKALARSGIKDSITADLFDPYTLLPYQNANNSVRVTDEFMRSVEADGYWDLKAVTTGETMETLKAREVMDWIADAAWNSADPGVQYDTTINEWHTCSNTGRINASNPCFTGDTIVSTDRGLIQFKDLYERYKMGEKIRVYTHNITSKNNPTDSMSCNLPTRVMTTGVNDIYKIIFSNGAEIKCTKNHRFWTVNQGYVSAKNLKSIDQVKLANQDLEFLDADSQINIDTDKIFKSGWGGHPTKKFKDITLPSVWTSPFSEYVGYLVGDGCITEARDEKRRFSNASVVFSNQDDADEILPRFESVIKELNVQPYIITMANGTVQMRINRTPFIRFLKGIGVSDKKAHEKHVPDSIFKAPKNIIAGFLRGLFSADGCVYDGKNHRYVGLASSSESLLKEVQILLLSFGITSAIYGGSNRDNRFTYTKKDGTLVTYESKLSFDLRITCENIKKFNDKVGFLLSAKQEKLAALLRNHEFYQTDETVRVKDYQYIGKELTYSLTEPQNHSFVANGFVVANCSEYMHIDNSACNLASLNLLKFLKEGGKFNVDLFKKAVDTVILAQDIIVDNSSYPTEKITQNARDYRELGLGYANLGALLMVLGLPYDSDSGRYIAGHITSLMCGEAYKMSALIADMKGPYAGYAMNQEPQLNVIAKHLACAEQLYSESKNMGMEDDDIQSYSLFVWKEALDLARQCGVRNSQVTVLAPTGTIAFLMDCDTTGIEPELGLVKYKKLVGGGTLKLVNTQVPLALRRLGHSNQQIEEISNHILDKETIEGAPHLKDEHIPVFDCSFKPLNGKRSINYHGHLKMMAAAQPFISGAISKTVNLPSDATVEDVKNVYIEGWRLGLKAIALYRDGCKSIQPLNLSDKDKLVERANGYTRIKLPDERPAVTHKFNVAGHKGYLTIGLYPETNQPGETFLTIAKEGSTISGLLDVIATMTSICLQSGVPLRTLVKKFKDMRFDPAGFTTNSEIPMAKSVVDYMFRYMGMKYLSPEEKAELFGTPSPDNSLEAESTSAHVVEAKLITTNMDAPACGNCGTLMVKAGSCYSCPNCFTTTGVCN